jgi:putative glycosyltransferase (TIGR04348 family)
MPLRITLVCPAPPGSRQGNRITALRWARILKSLGHRVRIRPEADDADVLIALHARKSADAARAFRERHPERPLVVALTGTDLYKDLPGNPQARRSIAIADRLIVLQPAALARLPAEARRKARVIHQSAIPPARRARRARESFDVCVLAHLRPVKDPFRAALAARLLSAASRVRIVHAGRSLTPALAARARAEMARNSRYIWVGERSHTAARALLARCRLLILSSRMEGGANVIGEAAVCGVPVLSSRIDGSIGLLGRHYPGFFPVGDTKTLAALLRRAETNARFRESLRCETNRIASLFRPARERRAWQSLIRELRPKAGRRAPPRS